MKQQKSIKGFYNWTVLLILVAAVILINVISNFLYVRIDMTKDQRYSLAEGTKKFLSDKKNFESRVTVQIYLEGNLPAEIKHFQNALKDKLVDFKSFAGNRIEYSFIDPNEGSKQD